MEGKVEEMGRGEGVGTGGLVCKIKRLVSFFKKKIKRKHDYSMLNWVRKSLKIVIKWISSSGLPIWRGRWDFRALMEEILHYYLEKPVTIIRTESWLFGVCYFNESLYMHIRANYIFNQEAWGLKKIRHQTTNTFQFSQNIFYIWVYQFTIRRSSIKNVWNSSVCIKILQHQASLMAWT